MGEMLFTFGAVRQAQDDIHNTSNRLNQQMEDLKNFLKPLVASWQGSAQEAYQARQRDWDQASADLNNVLAQIAVAVGEIHDNSQDTERKIHDSFNM